MPSFNKVRQINLRINITLWVWQDMTSPITIMYTQYLSSAKRQLVITKFRLLLLFDWFFLPCVCFVNAYEFPYLHFHLATRFNQIKHKNVLLFRANRLRAKAGKPKRGQLIWIAYIIIPELNHYNACITFVNHLLKHRYIIILDISFCLWLFLLGDSFIVFSDFIKTLEEYKKPDDKQDLVMAFRVFDPENKGFIEAKELKKALLELKDTSKEEIEDVLESADLEKDRHIYFDGGFVTKRVRLN